MFVEQKQFPRRLNKDVAIRVINTKRETRRQYISLMYSTLNQIYSLWQTQSILL